MIKRVYNKWLYFTILVTIIVAINIRLTYQNSNDTWDVIAPYGEELFWKNIPSSVIESLGFDENELSTRAELQELIVEGLIYLAIFSVTAFVLLFMIEAIKEK